MPKKLDTLFLELSREFRLFGRGGGAAFGAAGLSQLIVDGDVQMASLCFALGAQLYLGFVGLGLCLRMLVDDHEVQ